MSSQATASWVDKALLNARSLTCLFYRFVSHFKIFALVDHYYVKKMSHRKFTDHTRVRSNTANRNTKGEKQKYYCLPKMQTEQEAKFYTLTNAAVNLVFFSYISKRPQTNVKRMHSLFSSKQRSQIHSHHPPFCLFPLK